MRKPGNPPPALFSAGAFERMDPMSSGAEADSPPRRRVAEKDEWSEGCIGVLAAGCSVDD